MGQLWTYMSRYLAWYGRIWCWFNCGIGHDSGPEEPRVLRFLTEKVALDVRRGWSFDNIRSGGRVCFTLEA